MIGVVVHAVSGDRLDLQLPPESPVSALKACIAGSWSVPVRFQELVRPAGAAVLGDADRLDDHRGADGAPLLLTLVLRLAGTERDLGSGDRERQVRALDDLAALGPRGGPASVGLLGPCLGDADDDVRRAARMALARAARPGGDTRAAAAEAASLAAAADWRARLGAIAALELTAPRGDAAALEALRTGLGDENGRVRRAAVRALAGLAQPGDRGAVCLLAARLEDETAWVRAAAARAVAAVAERGDPHAVALLGARVEEDKDRETRRAAMWALAEVSPRGDPGTLALLGRQLEDEAAASRRAAAEAVAAVAEPGDRFAAGLLAARLRDDESRPVREAAAAGLAALAA